MIGFQTHDASQARSGQAVETLFESLPVHVPYSARDLAAGGHPDPTALLPFVDADLRSHDAPSEGELPGARALEAGHEADSAFSIGEGTFGLLGDIVDEVSTLTTIHHLMERASPYVTSAGGALGAINIGSGLAHMWRAGQRGELSGSEGSQGALDVASGVAGAGNLLAYLGTGSVCPPLAIAAGVAGLADAGNEYAEKHGMYGEHVDPKTGRVENATFLNSIGDGARHGWRWGHRAFGNGPGGDFAGGVTGGVDAGLHLLHNSGAAVFGGISALLDGAGWQAVHPRSPEWMPHPLGIDPNNLTAAASR